MKEICLTFIDTFRWRSGLFTAAQHHSKSDECCPEQIINEVLHASEPPPGTESVPRRNDNNTKDDFIEMK
jgi:hypothetical protein